MFAAYLAARDQERIKIGQTALGLLPGALAR
jgi:hypothetical protein